MFQMHLKAFTNNFIVENMFSFTIKIVNNKCKPKKVHIKESVKVKHNFSVVKNLRS